MKKILSKKVSLIAPSLTLEITAKAKKMKAEGISVIGFGAGEPDFNTPDFIIESCKNALDKGLTKYTPASGMQELKVAICEKFKKDNGLSYKPENIVVSSGAKASLFHAISAIVDKGDNVILPSPYWLTYPELISLAGGKTVFVKTTNENNFKITKKQLEKAINRKTKALILNSPNNPTGSVYTEKELKELAKVCEKHKIYVIADEIYEKLVYGKEKHFSIAKCSPYMKEHTIVINGMSKAFSMTGWRIGYLAAPVLIAKAISSMQSHTASNPTSFCQAASITALTDNRGRKFIADMKKTFDERRKFMYSTVSKIKGLKPIEPKGAFYLFVDVSNYYDKKFGDKIIKGSLDFAECALKKGIALIPGIAFGDDNCIRLSYAISIEDIKEGLKRLKDFVKEIK